MAKEQKPLKPSFQRPIAKKRGIAAPAPQDDQDKSAVTADLSNGGSESTDEENALEVQRRRDILESTVNDHIREAINGRQNSGIEEVWRESDDLFNGIDEKNAPTSNVKTRDQTRHDALGNSRSKVVLNITKPKTDSGVARVQEMLVPTDDKPWAVEPTPIPEIDAAAKASMGKTATLADGVQVDAALVAKYIKEKSSEAAEEESTWIEDRLVEGNVYGHMRDTIRDAGRLGTGVLKGPTPVEYTDRRWSVTAAGTALEIIKRIDPTSKRVRPEDCFPDPACGDNIQNGEYFAEREFSTGRNLRKMANLDGYDRDGIAKALAEGPLTAAMWRTGDTTRKQEGDSVRESSLFELFYYHGFMRPEDLLLLGVSAEQIDETDLQLAAIPCVCTILNGRCIKATISPLESGEFPYSFFRWDKVDGQPWGRGIPWKMRTAQKGVTAGVRALLENAGLSAGPQIAFIKGALTPINGRYEVVGRKLWEFEANDSVDDIRKAFAVFNVPSMQNELLELVQFWLNMADQLTNLPMLLQGEQAAGTSPETLGGMKMLVSNASSPLRVIAKSYDDDLIDTQFGRYHDWYMANGNMDSPLKKFCDTRIKARGSTVLVQREEAREFLMQLFAVKDDPSLRIDPAKYIAEFARANGFNMANIQYTEDEWAKKQKELAQNPPPEDPRIAAAKLRNEGLQAQVQAQQQNNEAERQFRATQAQEDRAVQAFVKKIELQVEEMRLAGQQQVSLDSVKAMLAGKAMDSRVKTQEMQLKLAPQNKTHQGI